MSTLRRDFMPNDLQAEINAAGIDGVVSVQARQTIEETAWLLELAKEHAFMKGVVCWVPLDSPDVVRHLERFAADAKFKGVRHVLQDERDENFMLRKSFNVGIDALRAFDLVYDILILDRQLSQIIEFVDHHPEQVFVLDHLAKPRIRDGVLEPWRTNIRELARRENVFCKVSGAPAQADWALWTEAQLRPYIETALEAFGARRLMFGSDWPVCLVASTYSRWTQTVQEFAALLSPHEQRRIFGATATEVYHL